MKLFAVFKVDCWHTRSSRNLLAVATSKGVAISLIKEMAAIEDAVLSADDLHLLNSINQTQGYNGEGEFIIDEIEADML